MAPLRRWWVLVLAAGTLAAFVAVSVWLAKSKPNGASAAHVRAWTEGEERSYALDLRVSLSSGQQSTQFSVGGDWTLAAVQAGERPVLRAALLNAKLTADSGEPAALRKYEEELSRPVFVHLGLQQEITLVSVAPGTSTFIENLTKATLAFAQFVVPASGEKAWSTVEDDTLGRYSAKYDLVAPGRFTKVKHSYVEILAGGLGQIAGLPPMQVDRFSADFTVAERVVSDLALKERLVTGGNHGQVDLPAIAVETSLTLRQKGIGKAAFDLVAARAQLSKQPADKLYRSVPSEVRKSDLNHARSQGKSLPELLTDLRALPKDAKAARVRRAKTFVAMTAVLRENDAAVEHALAAVKARSPDTRAIVDALGSAGSAKSQSALLKVLEFGDPSLKQQAVRALGNSQSLTPDSSRALHDLFDDRKLGGDAKLALGAATNSMLANEREGANESIALLTGALDSAKTTGELIDALRAVGNSGHPAALPKVEPYLSDQRPMVRAAAAQALRRIEGIKADHLLARAIRTDSEASVRRSALDAVRNREPSTTLLQAVIESVKLDTFANARLEATRALSRWGSRAPAAREALQWVAYNDDNEKIRRFASAALAAL